MGARRGGDAHVHLELLHLIGHCIDMQCFTIIVTTDRDVDLLEGRENRLDIFGSDVESSPDSEFEEHLSQRRQITQHTTPIRSIGELHVARVHVEGEKFKSRYVSDEFVEVFEGENTLITCLEMKEGDMLREHINGGILSKCFGGILNDFHVVVVKLRSTPKGQDQIIEQSYADRQTLKIEILDQIHVMLQTHSTFDAPETDLFETIRWTEEILIKKNVSGVGQREKSIGIDEHSLDHVQFREDIHIIIG